MLTTLTYFELVIAPQKDGWKTYLSLHLLRAYTQLRCNSFILIFPTLLFSFFTLKKAHMFFVLFPSPTRFPKTCCFCWVPISFFSVLVTRQQAACTNNTIACCHWSLLAQALRVASKIIPSIRRRSCDALRRDKACCHAPPGRFLSKALNKKIVDDLIVSVINIKLVGSRDFDVRGAKIKMMPNKVSLNSYLI